MAVIVTSGGTASAIAAKSASVTIPIVFNVTEDPVKLGLVASLNRPGGNATGVTNLATALEEKRLGLLQEAAPQARVFAILVLFPRGATRTRAYPGRRDPGPPQSNG